MKKIILFLFPLVVVVLLGAGCQTESMKEAEMMTEEEKEMMAEKSSKTTIKKEEIVVVNQEMAVEMMKVKYQYSGELEDVTNKQDVLGINTLGISSGVAKASFADNKYNLLVTFENLPEPKGTDFYEGWLVRRGAFFHVISTGRVDKIDGVYTNIFSANKDLTNHDFYVLTIEPDDNNPAPADHILEGVMTK